MNKPALHRATIADAALVASIHARSWATTYRGSLPDAFLDHDVHQERAAYWQRRMREIDSGVGEVTIAEIDGKPIAFLCMVAPDENGYVFVDNLHALPQCKGLRAGSTLLKHAEQWARDRNAIGLYLYVFETNIAAIGFYESRGWQLSGRHVEQRAGVDVVALHYALSFA
jgi:GNAT superfamily N-acetyltransferase